MSTATKAIVWKRLKPEQRDRLVAEKIMDIAPTCTGQLSFAGWQPAWSEKRYDIYACVDCNAILTTEHAPIAKEHARAAPRYSQSIDEAWKMLRHLIGNHSDTYERAKAFFRELGKIEGPVHVVMQWADFRDLTAEKLCIAALRAVGCEVNE